MKSFTSPFNGRYSFFQEFLRHPLQIGSIIPSSHFLEQRILEVAAIDSARVVVELGAGIGNLTRAILHMLPQDARLLSIEVNPRFHAMVSEIDDARLIAHLGSACELNEILADYGLDMPEVVISGIPFSTMPHQQGSRVVEAVSSQLAPNGRFVAYQVSKRIASLCRPHLGPEQSGIELLNIPPMRVFKWQKNNL